MSISYQTKQKLLETLSIPESWKNTLDLDAILKRKEQRKTKNTITKNTPLKNGRFFHSFDIPQSLFKSWNIPEHQALSFVTLVIAHDLGLQPQLTAFNSVSSNDMRALFTFMERNKKLKSTKAKQENISALIAKKLQQQKIDKSLEKPWSDSTEFTGIHTESPNSFLIEKTKQGYRISTSLDGREAIIACSTIFEHAVSNGNVILPISATTSENELKKALEKGKEAEDHRKTKWVHGIVKALDKAPDIRQMLTQKFGLSTGEHTLIKFDSTYAMLALQQTALDNLRTRDTQALDRWHTPHKTLQ